MESKDDTVIVAPPIQDVARRGESVVVSIEDMVEERGGQKVLTTSISLEPRSEDDRRAFVRLLALAQEDLVTVSAGRGFLPTTLAVNFHVGVHKFGTKATK